jgi:chitosanase
MDIDCDGVSRQPNSGRCGVNPTDQGVTAMRDTIRGYAITGLTDLDTYVHPYVVFGNSGTNPHNVPFEPRDVGVLPLSIMLIVTPTVMVIWTSSSTQYLHTLGRLTHMRIFFQ